MSICRVALVAAGVALWSTFAPPVLADDSSTARARSLFDQGRALMDDARYREACSKFDQSLRLDPALVGSEFNLADCSAKLGQKTRARALYLDVAEKTHALGQTERERLARERVAALDAEPEPAVVEPLVVSAPPLAASTRSAQCAEAVSTSVDRELDSLVEATARLRELERGLSELARARPRDPRLPKLKQRLRELEAQLAAAWSLAGNVAAQIAARSPAPAPSPAATKTAAPAAPGVAVSYAR